MGLRGCWGSEVPALRGKGRPPRRRWDGAGRHGAGTPLGGAGLGTGHLTPHGNTSRLVRGTRRRPARMWCGPWGDLWSTLASGCPEHVVLVKGGGRASSPVCVDLPVISTPFQPQRGGGALRSFRVPAGGAQVMAGVAAAYSPGDRDAVGGP